MTASDEKMIQTTEEIFNSVAHGTYNIDEKWIRAAALRQKIDGHCRYWSGVLDPMSPQDAEARRIRRKQWRIDNEGDSFGAWCINKLQNGLLSLLTTPQPEEESQ